MILPSPPGCAARRLAPRAGAFQPRCSLLNRPQRAPAPSRRERVRCANPLPNLASSRHEAWRGKPRARWRRPSALVSCTQPMAFSISPSWLATRRTPCFPPCHASSGALFQTRRKHTTQLRPTPCPCRTHPQRCCAVWMCWQNQRQPTNDGAASPRRMEARACCTQDTSRVTDGVVYSGWHRPASSPRRPRHTPRGAAAVVRDVTALRLLLAGAA